MRQKSEMMNRETGIKNVGNLIACHKCDMLHQSSDADWSEQGAKLRSGRFVAKCRRCGSVLYRRKQNSLERTLALMLAGLILFVIANTFSFMSFEMGVRTRQTTLITGIAELYHQGWPALAGLVMLTTVVAPFLQIMGMLYILLPLRADRLPPKFTRIFRFVRSIQQWSMMEIFMLGILIALVKLAKMARIVPGVALFAFMALIFVMAAAINALDPDMIWKRWQPKA